MSVTGLGGGGVVSRRLVVSRRVVVSRRDVSVDGVARPTGGRVMGCGSGTVTAGAAGAPGWDDCECRNWIGWRNSVEMAMPCRFAGAYRSRGAPATAAESNPE